MRRCFARILLLMNLVGKESPRCLTLSADRTQMAYADDKSTRSFVTLVKSKGCRRV